MKTKKVLVYTGVIFLFCIAMVAIYIYPFYSFFFTPVTTTVSPQLTVISGSGNSSIVKTDSAVLVIDTKMASMAKDLYKTVKEIAGTRVIIVINTHLHDDHVHGNYLFTASKIYIGSYDKAYAARSIKLKDMPTDFVIDSLVINLGNEDAVLLNIGQAHTFSDLVVYLRKSKTLITGDIVFNKINPALIRDDGTDIDKWMAGLDKLNKRWDIRKVVPGHGDAGGPELLSEMIQYFTDMKIAATDKNQAAALKKKYDGWRKMPLMSSPGRTIDFINAKN
jgi:metallo-beta-lactamase class B